MNTHNIKKINDPKVKIIDEVSTAIRLYFQSDNRKLENLSTFITSYVNYDYSYLSSLYSMAVGRTIEQTYIAMRIEKAKMLLAENTHSITQIAHLLGYGSIHYLSAQFKQITGLTPSHFKKVIPNS